MKPGLASIDSGTAQTPRRAFINLAMAGATAAPVLDQICSAAEGAAASASTRSLLVPLDRAEPSLSVEGPHRFRSIAGRTGLQVTSLNTKATVKTNLLRADRGTLSLWFSPLEDLTFSPPNTSDANVAFEFPLVCDVFPSRDIGQAVSDVTVGRTPSTGAGWPCGRHWAATDLLPEEPGDTADRRSRANRRFRLRCDRHSAVRTRAACAAGCGIQAAGGSTLSEHRAKCDDSPHLRHFLQCQVRWNSRA